ncbi:MULTISPECIES: hypothetical protein [unclassified Luteimonas]
MLASLALLSACTTPEAPGVRGRWKPVNGFAQAPQAIPLQEMYLYRAHPADATLKTMLGRWARDRKMSLSYLHPNDYTLHEPVARIHTADMHAAVRALSDAYAAQGVHVAVQDNQIVVRAASATVESES